MEDSEKFAGDHQKQQLALWPYRRRIKMKDKMIGRVLAVTEKNRGGEKKKEEGE